MKFIIPGVINNFIPVDYYEKAQGEIFELILDSILTGGSIKDNSTRHTVLEAMLPRARNENHITLLIKWFTENKVSNSAGKILEDVELSLKHKHSIMERIWASEKIDLAQKEDLMKQLAAQDKSDWLEKTKKVCAAANPLTKREVWDFYFDQNPEAEINKWSFHSYSESFRGFNQVHQRKLLEQFEDEFFQKIE